jgi:hypothetical protein
MRIDDPVKMKGHNLKGRKRILNPVMNETTDRIFNTTTDNQYTTCETGLVKSVIVTAATRAPIKTRVTPSTIHSMVMTRLLSRDTLPNPRTMPAVAAR